MSDLQEVIQECSEVVDLLRERIDGVEDGIFVDLADLQGKVKRLELLSELRDLENGGLRSEFQVHLLQKFSEMTARCQSLEDRYLLLERAIKD